ncbi:MAG: DNA polymerase III subunit [Chitinivibrionia bacterium]|nr:DNA polymerase III subunit [Chitinivibrionia bacterium]
MEFKTIGHQRIKEQLASALKSEKLGHAYLFSGEGGIGKFSMALEFAMAYLCKASTGSATIPCGECESCKGIKKYNNPYFQYLFPLSLDTNLRKNDDFTQDGWDYVREKTLERINEPYSLITDYSAPIYISRIRGMNDTILGGKGNKTITIIDGIDTLTDKDLNTMLKTLEEPPAGALIILLARFSVLPTIRSRCIEYKFGTPNSDEVKAFLKTKATLKSDEEISYLAQISQNNIGVALQKMSQDGAKIQKSAKEFAEILFNQKSEFAKFTSLEKFTNGLGRDFDLSQQILVYFLSQIRTNFLQTATMRNGEKDFSRFINFEQANLCCDAIDKSILSMKRSSPLSMVFADLTIKLTEIFDERK